MDQQFITIKIMGIFMKMFSFFIIVPACRFKDVAPWRAPQSVII